MRTTSMREMIVPRSFDVHRTKANALPGAKLATRVRRLKTRSSAIRPKRIQCSSRHERSLGHLGAAEQDPQVLIVYST